MSAKQAINNKLQGSVSTYLRCGGVVNNQIKKSLLLSLWVKKFLKSVNIWQNYKQERDCIVYFLRLLAVCWPGAQHFLFMSESVLSDNRVTSRRTSLTHTHTANRLRRCWLSGHVEQWVVSVSVCVRVCWYSDIQDPGRTAPRAWRHHHVTRRWRHRCAATPSRWRHAADGVRLGSKLYANMRLPHISLVAAFFAYFSRVRISHILAFSTAILILFVFILPISIRFHYLDHLLLTEWHQPCIQTLWNEME